LLLIIVKINYLQQNISHSDIWSFDFPGLLTGCSIALIVGVILLVHVRNIMYSEGRTQYMENIFPLYR